jgi:hypothetical protein
MEKKEVYCTIHPATKMICPRCIAAAGGASTAKKYGSETLARWGRSGGRPKKRKRKRRSDAGRPRKK